MQRRAFTLIEILIVVVILGVIAAIVTPLVASSAVEARSNAARAQLATVRGQIEVYQARWNGALPPVDAGAAGLWAALRAGTLENPSLLTQDPTLPEHFAWTWDGDLLGLSYDGPDPALAAEVPSW